MRIQPQIAIDCRFIYVDCGSNGRMSDGGVWGDCWISQAIDSQTICLPPPEELLSVTGLGSVHYHLIEDKAFPPKVDLQKAVPQQNLSQEERISN